MDNQTASKILELMTIDLTGLLAGISKRNPLDDVVKQRIEAINVAQKVLSDADVSSVRHGEIIETSEGDKMKRTFSCCGTDFTQMTCWMTPKYCPNCGAKMNPIMVRKWRDEDE
jgi:hypothetical protein